MAAAGRTRVFISYSRKDREFALRLSDALQAKGVEVFRDLDDILPTEEWWPRIEALIGAADTIVFVISADSVASPICAREIALCEKFNKRLAPIVWREASVELIPDRLSRLNYIFFTAADDFGRALNMLVAALETDIGWVREHTRIGELARRWEGSAKRGLLLSGDELKEAEAWLFAQPHSASAPAVTALHREFVQASRAAAVRRQRWIIVLSLNVALFAGALAGVALWQRGIAIENEKRATRERDRAQRALARVFAERAWQAHDRQDLLLAARYALAGSQLAPGVEAGNRAVLASLLHEANESVIVERRNIPLVAAAFSANAQRIVTTGSEAPVHVVDTSGRQIVSTFNKHDLVIRGAAFSPDMKAILSWSADSTARLWNVANGEEIRSSMEHAAPVTLALFSPDGKSVVTVSETRRINAESVTLHGWATTGGQPRWSTPLKSDVLAVRITNDSSQVIVVTANRIVESFEIGKGTRLFTRRLSGGIAASAAAVAPDGGGFVLANSDGTLSIFNADASTRIAALRGHQGPVRRIAVGGGMTVIATVGSDNTVRIWDGTTGDEITLLAAHAGRVTDVSFSPVDVAVLTASEDGTARIWKPGRRLGVLDKQSISALAFHPDGKRAALAGAETINVVGVDRLDAAPLALKWPRPGGRDRRILALAFLQAPDRILAIDNYGASVTFNLTTGKQESAPDGPYPLFAAAISPDASRIAATDFQDPTTVTVTDARTGVLIAQLTEHLGVAFGLSFSRDGKRLAVGTQDGDARLWNVDTREVVLRCGVAERTFKSQSPFLRMMGQDLGAVASSPSGDRMAVGLAGGLVRICSHDPDEVVVLRAHSQLVRSLTFDSSSELIASSDGNSGRVWDVNAARQIAEFGSHIGEMAFSPDRTRLITGAKDYIDKQGRAIEPRPTAIWDTTRLSQPIEVLSASTCNNLLVADAKLFHPVEISEDRLIRDAWLANRPDGDVCR
jgi:WD40 repeat protein